MLGLGCLWPSLLHLHGLVALPLEIQLIEERYVLSLKLPLLLVNDREVVGHLASLDHEVCELKLEVLIFLIDLDGLVLVLHL